MSDVVALMVIGALVVGLAVVGGIATVIERAREHRRRWRLRRKGRTWCYEELMGSVWRSAPLALSPIERNEVCFADTPEWAAGRSEEIAGRIRTALPSRRVVMSPARPLSRG